MNNKEFFTLEELSSKFKCEEVHLIDLAIQGNVPVFIAANNWYAHVWKKPYSNVVKDEDEDATKAEVEVEVEVEEHIIYEETINFGDWILDTSKDKPINLNNSLIRLKNSSLVAYQLNDIVNVGNFEANDSIQAPEEFSFEFRLCDPYDFSKPFEIDLKKHKLVIMKYSLSTINKLHQSESTLAEIELTVNERMKLLKITGALSLLISQSVTKYNINGEPNISAISESIETMFEKMKEENHDFNENGIKDSTRREVISKGIKALFEI